MDRVISIVNRANQRGRRMLSVIDLLEAGTLSEGQLAWLLERIRAGSSWLVGARPGGAGKTTVMCALLAMVPAGSVPRLAGPAGGGRPWESAGPLGPRDPLGPEDPLGPGDPLGPEEAPGLCLVAYELSPGFYEGYIWGADVRGFTQAGLDGCRIVANLHADTLAEAREQVADQCGATEQGLAAFQIFLPLRVTGERSARVPVVERIHVWEAGRWRSLSRQDLEGYGRDGRGSIRGFLADCRARDLRRIEEVRTAWLAWCANLAPFS